MKKYTLFAATLLMLLTSCGTNHKIKGGTTNKVEVSITMDYSICDDPRFTVGQKLKCLELVYTMTVDADIEGLSGLEDSINSGEGLPSN